MGDRLGQSFVVDNRTGAGGSIAADNVAKSPPAGYSVLLGNIGSHALVPYLYAKPPYDAFKDLETACWIGTQPNLLACRPDFPHDTPQKLIAAARKDPGKSSYGSSGVGTSPDTPTFAEAGLPDLVVTSWSIWAVPTGTPQKIKDKLKLVTEQALKEPDVIESMKVGGFEPGTMSVANADAFIRTEYKRWGEVIRAAGIKPQ